MKVLVVCTHGKNRSVYLRDYLLSKGYEAEAAGLGSDGLEGAVRRSDAVVSVHPDVASALRRSLDLSLKRVVALDVEDRPELVLPEGRRLDGQEWLDFQNTHVYPRLIEQIDSHLPL